MKYFVKLKLTASIFSLLVSTSVVAEEKISSAGLAPGESIVPMFLGLCGILLVIFLLAILIKKVTGLNLVSNHIKVIESQNLGAKEKLVIVEIQEQQYVLGVTPNSINQICQLQDKVVKKAPELSFDKMMKKLLHPNQAGFSRSVSERLKPLSTRSTCEGE